MVVVRQSILDRANRYRRPTWLELVMRENRRRRVMVMPKFPCTRLFSTPSESALQQHIKGPFVFFLSDP